MRKIWDHKGKIALALGLGLGISALLGADASPVRQCETHLQDSTSKYRTCTYNFNLPSVIRKFFEDLANTSG